MSNPEIVSSVGEILRGAAAKLAASGSETPRLDAEVLLGHVLRVDRATLLAAPDARVGDGQIELFGRLIERRTAGEPVAYIRGLKEFFGLAFTVDERALIPRPETERLVELALERLGAMLTAAPRPMGTPPLEVLDVGTGSGAIAITLAVEARRRGFEAELHVVATDVSPDAIALAVENAVGHGVADAVEFAQVDLAAGLPPAVLLLANLPYIPSAIVPALPVAARFEPRLALDGGPDGLDLIRRLAAQLPGQLTEGGVCLLEIGADQADAVRALVVDLLPDWRVAVHDDLAGRPRVAEIGRRAP